MCVRIIHDRFDRFNFGIGNGFGKHDPFNRDNTTSPFLLFVFTLCGCGCGCGCGWVFDVCTCLWMLPSPGDNARISSAHRIALHYLITGLGLASMVFNMVGGIMLVIDTSENTVYVQDASSGPPPGCCNTGMQ